MITVRMMPEFSQWLQNMRDRRARKIVIGRIERAAFGNVGKFRDLG